MGSVPVASTSTKWEKIMKIHFATYEIKPKLNLRQDSDLMFQVRRTDELWILLRKDDEGSSYLYNRVIPSIQSFSQKRQRKFFVSSLSWEKYEWQFTHLVHSSLGCINDYIVNE